MVRECARNYTADQNPLYAWMAFLLATAEGLELEPWVVEYFQGSGARLLDLVDGPPHDPPHAIARALGFRAGKPSEFARFMKATEDLEVVGAVADLREARPEDRMTAIVTAAAVQLGVDEKSVRRALQRSSKFLEPIAEGLRRLFRERDAPGNRIRLYATDAEVDGWLARLDAAEHEQRLALVSPEIAKELDARARQRDPDPEAAPGLRDRLMRRPS